MAISVSGMTNKIGKIGVILVSMDTYRNGLGTVFSDIRSQFSGDYDLLDTHYANQVIGENLPRSTADYAASLAQATLIRIASNDQPSISMTLYQAMVNFIADMKAASQTVQSNTVSQTNTVGGSNVGNGPLVTSIENSDGTNAELVYGETIRVKVTADSYSSTNNVNAETITISGQKGVVSMLDANWPSGSGATTALTVVDPSLAPAGGTAQYLTNGNMETYTTPNIPDGWAIVTGTAGTTIVRSSTAFVGSYSLGIVGDGSTNVSLTQTFGVGTPIVLTPLTTYAVSLWVRVAVVPASGVLTIDLINGSGSTVSDANSVANSFTKTISGLTANTWTNVTGVFRTPAAPTSNYALRLRASTPISSGTTLLIDWVGLTRMSQLYPGSPYFTVFAGSTPFFLGDKWTSVVTNDRAGHMQTLFDRFFNMRSMGLQLPSSGSPTVTEGFLIP